ncbi:hypothetical protein H7I75_21260 [Mycobacterium stomatepiae]|nr:hypothetical protein [Mycobacterium stomatepiae]
MRLNRSAVFVNDVDGGLLGGGSTSVDTDVIGYQLGFGVFAKAHVWRDESAGSHAADLTPLWKVGFALGFVGPVP